MADFQIANFAGAGSGTSQKMAVSSEHHTPAVSQGTPKEISALLLQPLEVHHIFRVCSKEAALVCSFHSQAHLWCKLIF